MRRHLIVPAAVALLVAAVVGVAVLPGAVRAGGLAGRSWAGVPGGLISPPPTPTPLPGPVALPDTTSNIHLFQGAYDQSTNLSAAANVDLAWNTNMTSSTLQSPPLNFYYTKYDRENDERGTVYSFPYYDYDWFANNPNLTEMGQKAPGL